MFSFRRDNYIQVYDSFPSDSQIQVLCDYGVDLIVSKQADQVNLCFSKIIGGCLILQRLNRRFCLPGLFAESLEI